MLQRLFARNDDLRHLRDDGYELALSASNNHLLISHVPYVNATKDVRYGTLVMALATNGELLNPPADHVAYFIGEQPCDIEGKIIGGITNPSAAQDVDKGLHVDRTFSGKPEVPYKDFYEKVVRYVTILEGPAVRLDPSATSRTHPPYALTEDESVFKYADTASSRAGIAALSQKLELGRIAIVGLGGTGSYILDLVAKTPVREIHIFDGDVFSSHNAFRSPGAASLEELHTRPSKAAYFSSIYSRMHRGVVAHEYFVDAGNVEELAKMEFVFLSLDRGEPKRTVVQFLLEKGIPFVDVGMGVNYEEGCLMGVLRTTASSKVLSSHVMTAIPFGDGDKDDEYAKNIQIADLNTLNAALAVIKWKKSVGFYMDQRGEHSTHYTLSQNTLVNQHPA